jgi:ABC-type multidrug transport system permease subunit
MMLVATSTFVWVLLGLLYFVLLVTLGVMTIRKGHWFMFIVGIFIPLFWVIGALMPPTQAAAESRPAG